MTVSFQPLSADAEAAFQRWLKLTHIVRKADAMVTGAIARIARADRLRAASPRVAIGQSASRLAKAVEGARDGHAVLAVVPEFLVAATVDRDKARDALDEELSHE